MALQWRQSSNALKAAKTLGEMLITLALNYASPKLYQEAGALFLHQDDFSAFKKVLPSKLFEYTVMGSPI
jgi:hypothetical protein